MSEQPHFTGRSRDRSNRFGVQVADVVSRLVITIGGIGTIIAVSAVCIFLLFVAGRLFRSATMEHAGVTAAPWEAKGGETAAGAGGTAVVHMVSDEYRVMGWSLLADGVLLVFDLRDGSIIERRQLFEGRTLTARAFAHRDDGVAFGFADGSIQLGTIGFRTTFLPDIGHPDDVMALKPGEVIRHGQGVIQRTEEEQLRQQTIFVSLEDPIDTGLGDAVVRIDQVVRDTGPILAYLSSGGELRLSSVTRKKNLLTGKVTTRLRGGQMALPSRPDRSDAGLPAHLLLSSLGNDVIVAWPDGFVMRVDVRRIQDPRIVEHLDLVPEPDVRLTALRFAIGRLSLVAGDSLGRLNIWFKINPEPGEEAPGDVGGASYEFEAPAGGDPGDPQRGGASERMVLAHVLPAHDAPVTSLAVSARSRLLVAGYADSTVSVFYTTSAQRLATDVAGPPAGGALDRESRRASGGRETPGGTSGGGGTTGGTSGGGGTTGGTSGGGGTSGETSGGGGTSGETSGGDSGRTSGGASGGGGTSGETSGGGGGVVLAAAIAPKEDGVVVATAGAVTGWDLDAGHPEATVGTLFGKVWYEGYTRPEHVWQSSSGTDEEEPKYGLFPLVFGTIKATFYSMLFGAPLALLAAIYTSEFLHPRVKGVIKPTIELMASLPSVVLGFIAALVLAPFVERIVPAALTVFVALPLTLLLGAFLWQLLPRHVAIRWEGMRLLVMVALIPVGVVLALATGSLVESALFSGDIMAWLDGQVGDGTGGWMLLLLPATAVAVAAGMTLWVNPALREVAGDWSRERIALLSLGKFVAGTVVTLLLAWLFSKLLAVAGFDPRGGFVDTYDQRNALIVGFAMGFAIIPIIYTISEDALSAVPEHLRSGSLGSGATPWQTAIRIIVPTAMSGLFSALMIGLGRAVGETMIVLMAAGNTPLMDWNVFSGFRTLSANIAVELPEAVRNSTHYRVLFLAALTLFVMTFVLNTAAELVRLRFRRRAVSL